MGKTIESEVRLSGSAAELTDDVPPTRDAACKKQNAGKPRSVLCGPERSQGAEFP